ncbi:cation transporter [Pseudomonas sp. GWSMS-1]|uniref:cation transporter n=1 Tax=Pseudomonas sp. GWSMS-1 TaxID=3308997 RepID=UPI003CE74DF0
MSTLKITGMTCDSCAVHVKDALEKVPGVQSADVSYAKGSAKLAIEVGTSPDALTAAVAGLGYRARWPMPLSFDAGRIARQDARSAGQKRQDG